MAKAQLAFLFCISLWFFCIHAQTIGVKTTVSQSGIDYLKTVGIEILQQQLSSISIPDISGDSSTPIGSVSYSLTGIVLTGVTIPTSDANLSPPSSLELDIQDASASMTMNWQYREDGWPHVSDSGTADVSISSTSITVVISLAESGGRPVATVTSCSVSIGSLSIDVHGGASWLYNWFIGAFSGTITNAAQSALQAQIPQAINQGLTSAFATLPVTETVSNGVEVNYELEANPVITSTYFTLSALGEFYDIAAPQEAPFTPSALPDIATTDMVQMFVSDYTFNSASFVYFTENQMEILVTDSMLPDNAPLRLNTTYFTDLIPQLPKTYPDAMFDLYVAATATPVATFTSDGASVIANGELQVLILPNKTCAFTLGAKVLTAGTATLSSTNIAAKLSFVNLTLSLINTTIGNFDVTGLNDLVGSLVTEGLLPLANKYLATGFPLPTVAGLTFIDPVIGWGSGYLYVATNATYVPPSAGAETVKVVN